MATPKRNDSAKVTQTSFGISLASANNDAFPVAYSDDVWDIAASGSALAKKLGASGQFDQHSINERLAGSGRFVDYVPTPVGVSDNHYPGSDTDTQFLALGLQAGDIVAVRGVYNQTREQDLFVWFTYHVAPTVTEVGEAGEHDPLVLLALDDGEGGICFTRLNMHSAVVDRSTTVTGVSIPYLHDGNTYELEPYSDVVLPTIPTAAHNRLGISIYITPLTDVTLLFTEGTGSVPWLGDVPDDFTLTCGSKWLLTIVDGICSLARIENVAVPETEEEEVASPLSASLNTASLFGSSAVLNATAAAEEEEETTGTTVATVDIDEAAEVSDGDMETD